MCIVYVPYCVCTVYVPYCVCTVYLDIYLLCVYLGIPGYLPAVEYDGYPCPVRPVPATAAGPSQRPVGLQAAESAERKPHLERPQDQNHQRGAGWDKGSICTHFSA